MLNGAGSADSFATPKHNNASYTAYNAINWHNAARTSIENTTTRGTNRRQAKEVKSQILGSGKSLRSEETLLQLYRSANEPPLLRISQRQLGYVDRLKIPWELREELKDAATLRGPPRELPLVGRKETEFQY